MVKVNYNLLPYKHTRKKSTGARAVHNAFYMPEQNTGSSIYRDYHTYDYFGFKSGSGNDKSQAQIKDKTASQRP